MSGSPVEGQRYRFADDEITWAGDCPWTGGYCFGTESGNLLFYVDEGQVPTPAFSGFVAEEAINGVAFFGPFMGVSTRSEINLFRLTAGRNFEPVGAGPGGAHGIVATPSGHFVAPMGTVGLFCVDLSQARGPRCWTDHAAGTRHNYYSLRYVSRAEDQEILVCAARNDGLLTIRLDDSENKNQIIGLTSPAVDFIDVCSLGVPESPYAIAALCHDRSLIFVRNILTEQNPKTVKFDQFRGAPYAILSARGHLFVLTSKEIVVLPELGSRFARGDPLDRPINYRHRAAQAVDAFISRGRELMILTDDGVDVFDISKLVQERSEAAAVDAPPDIHPWDELLEAPVLLKTDWHNLVASAPVSENDTKQRKSGYKHRVIAN